ncbi:MAG: serine/threonine protein kinase, partial [Muribaculaceae bacterium]|nr:serine/threonine protein kinase [Muribaculaceae bacterium]
MDTSIGLPPGTILQGKYRIEGILGQGGFGITYLAFDTTLKRKVAIKEFFPGDFCNRDKTTSHVSLGTENTRKQVERMKTRFKREAEHIAQFDNPGIVKIHSIFEENDTVYYEMDFIEGMSLSEMVKKKGPLPENVALRYIKV